MPPFPLFAAVLAASALLATPGRAGPDVPFRLEEGDRVALVGGLLAERMQHHGGLEARLQLLLPDHALAFRNLGFSGDELTVRQRTAGFPGATEWLDRVGATVVFGFWGFNESFAGPPGIEPYTRDLREWVGRVRAGGRRVLLFSTVPYEDVDDPLLVDAAEGNARLAPYDAAAAAVAAALGVPFVDLSTPLAAAYDARGAPHTSDGVHLNERGHDLVARTIAAALTGRDAAVDPERLASVRAAVLERNRLWFQRYRATDGYNVYGGRSTLAYADGVTNAAVLQRELEILDAMCEARDRVVQAIARGEEPPPVDVVLPPRIPVRTNRPGDGEDGRHVYRSGEEAIAAMTTAPSTDVTLFADEEAFPELVNPVQMAFDPAGRLWVAVWPSYPHWAPGDAMDDRLLVLEDEDGDGRADSCRTFAGGLHNPTGFEHWGGGVLVANAPDLLFLEDTDGDGVCDRRRRILHGLSSADTHHAANSFVIGPDGALYFQEGTFHRSQIETARGVVRNRDGCVWRFEPRSGRVERYVAYDFANPHGHVFDRWGQDFVTDGTGNVNYFALPFSGHLDPPAKHSACFPFLRQRSRPAAATEILSSAHFPPEWQGNYLVANVIGFQGVFRYDVLDDGAGFRAEELDPVLFSADPNFRPVDLEVGPDGALWVLDWHNALIGHMQHHLRDPGRDRSHGRVYRVTHRGAPLREPHAIAGRPLEALLEGLRDRDDRVRSRTRIELSARPSDPVVEAARAWARAIGPDDPDGDHHRLEALWVQQGHGVLDEGLMVRLLASRDPRARAAATRVLRQMREQATRPLDRLAALVDDPHPRVRLEALVGLSFFREARAAEAALKVLDHARDRFLDYALGETLSQLEPWWRAALTSGRPFATASPEGLAMLLRRLDDPELARVADGVALFRERLARPALDVAARRDALLGLARLAGSDPASELVAAIERADRRTDGHADHLLAGLFAALPAVPDASAGRLPGPLARLAAEGRRPSTRRLAAAALVRVEGSVIPAWEATAGDVARRIDLLDAAPFLGDDELARQLFPLVLGTLGGPPAEGAGHARGRYVRVELPGADRTLTLAEVEVWSGGENLAPSGTARQESVAWGGGAARAIDGERSGRYADGGQTHTAESRADPWWELDLGEETGIEAVTVWNRTDGALGRRLDGAVVRILDGARRTVFEATLDPAPAVSARLELVDPATRLRRRAVSALAALGVRTEEAVRVLVDRFDDPSLRAAVVRALRAIPADRWPDGAAGSLAARLTAALERADDAALAGPAGRELLAFTDELAPRLDEPARDALLDLRRRSGPRVVVLRPVRDRLEYDRAEFTVVAGRPVELLFENTDIMPHNLVVTAPGHLATVGLAAEEMARDPDAAARGFVPDRPEVLWATRLLQPGERETLRFTAPDRPGDHPYVCTFPGHWVRMNGVMRVAAAGDAPPPPITDLGASRAPGSPAGRPFVQEWRFEDLVADLDLVPSRSATRGLEVMRAASCLACHATGAGQGARVGPDLREVVARTDLRDLLAQILDPSRTIATDYVTEIFVTYDGEVVSGRVVDEDRRVIRVQADPYQVKEPVELRRRSVRLRRTSAVSGMPGGLLSTFERGDVLDLLAYLESLRVQEGN